VLTLDIVEQQDHEKEEHLFAEQERLAEQERARIAREQLEQMRQHEIENQRKAQRLCVNCGARLNAVLRILRRTRHTRCGEFVE